MIEEQPETQHLETVRIDARIFDRIAAEELAEKLKKKGSVIVDFAWTEVVLPEGVARWRELVSKNPGLQRGINFIGLDDAARTQFQIRGFVAHSGVVRGDGMTGGRPGRNTVVCKKCETALEIDMPGLFVCPSCGARMRMEQSGHTAYYESLKRFTR